MKLNIEATLAHLTQVQAALGVRAAAQLPDLDWAALEGEGIEVDGSEIDVDREGILRFHGQVVATYIRAQRTPPQGGWSRYKYHLSNCATIRSMRQWGRGERYTVTSRSDGRFACTVGSGSARLLRMQLCKNCLRALAGPEYDRLTHKERNLASRGFDLAAYHYTYQDVGRSKPVAPPRPAKSASAGPRSPAAASAPRAPERSPEPPPSMPDLVGLPDWVPADTCAQFQAALLHIDRHGAITEPELARMVGGARRARRFSRALDALTENAPYVVFRSSRDGRTQFRRSTR